MNRYKFIGTFKSLWVLVNLCYYTFQFRGFYLKLRKQEQKSQVCLLYIFQKRKGFSNPLYHSIHLTNVLESHRSISDSDRDSIKVD